MTKGTPMTTPPGWMVDRAEIMNDGKLGVVLRQPNGKLLAVRLRPDDIADMPAALDGPA